MTNTTQKSDRVLVFDTTLRDGEQAPGYSLAPAQKMKMARQLAALNVDIIEAGFAAASPGDFESVRQVATQIKGPTICSLARANQSDIRAAGQALEPADRRRIHIFLATSPIHREFKLQMSREEVLKAAVAAVKEASQWVDEVEFSPEDAIRTEYDFLTEVIAAVIDAGCTTVNIPDTVGFTTPSEIFDLFSHIQDKVPTTKDVVLSAHCHDDLGMAVANSLAALQAGARQIECTINGIGERAGNCSLEEAVMALKVRKEHFGLDTGIDTTKLYEASQLLCDLTGNVVARNKAIVGKNAFAHEAGIHQHGVLANKATYEIMTPGDVGIPDTSLVLGKHSGKHALSARAKSLGYELSDNQLKSIFVAFKELADRKKEVLDSDLEALIQGVEGDARDMWSLGNIHVNSGIGADSLCYAVVEMTDRDGNGWREAATADSPEEAIFQAVCKATGVDMAMTTVSVHTQTSNHEEPYMADVEMTSCGRQLSCSNAGKDMMTALALACVSGANQASRFAGKRAKSGETPAAVAAPASMGM